MINIVRNLALVLLFSIAFFGCNTEKEKMALRKIDKVKSDIDKITQNISSIDIDSARIHYRNLSQLKELFPKVEGVHFENEDTIEMIRNIVKMVKMYESGIPKHRVLIKKITVFTQTIENLNYDVSKGLIPEDSIDIYLGEEMTRFKDIDLLYRNNTAIFKAEALYEETHKSMYQLYDFIMTGLEQERFKIKQKQGVTK